MQQFDRELGNINMVASSDKAFDFERKSRDLATQAVTAFASVVDEMGKIRSLHGEICSNLDQFSELVASGDDNAVQLHALEDEIRDLLTALTQFSDLSVSPTARSQSRLVRNVLDSIDKCARVLSAIASLMGTTVASLGLKNLDKFIAELRETASSIARSCEQVGHHLGSLDERGQKLLTSCNRAGAVLRDLTPKLVAPRDRLDKLSADEANASAQISQRARDLTRDGKTHLNSFVTAMQFSDRLAQRLDHLANMLVEIDGQIGHLAAAQARSCVRDINDVAGEVRATMVQLADLGHAGARLFSDGRLGDTISAGLDARSEMAQLVTAELISVHSVVEVAQTEAEYAAQMATATGESFDGLKDASKNLSLASFNSMLVSNRYAKACGPMKVMSKEVRQIASDCLVAVDQAQAAIQTITQGGEGPQHELVSATEKLEHRIAAFRGQTEAGSKRLADINEMREGSSTCAQSLVFMVDAVTESMARIDRVAAQLTDLAQALDAAGNPNQTPDLDRLAAVWASYTMEEERAVHRQVFPDQAGLLGADTPATSTSDDDIDDLLF